MKVLKIGDKAVSLTYPKELEFIEQNPFNPARPKKLKLFEKARGRNTYLLPRTYILDRHNIDKLDIPDFLLDKQKDAVSKLSKYNYGIMLSGVGSGKSFMMAALTKMFQGNTLVIAPKIEIAKGLYEKFINLGIEAEIFKKDKFKKDNPPKVLIAVQRSVDMYWETLSFDKVYKQVLIDEIHMNFTKNRIHFFIHYKYDKIYGFTGTPELNNFPPEALFKLFNDVYVDSGIRPKNPEVYYIQHSGNYLAEDWQELVNVMYWDKARLKKFLLYVYSVMKQPDRNMGIVFVDRKDIAKAIAYGLEKLGVPSYAYTGELSTKKRKQILDELTEKKGVMVATYQTVGTGFDHPPLDTAFYFMFIKFKAQVKQAVGRILRGAENPKFYDFQDRNLRQQVSSRIKAYKEMWGDIKLQPYTLPIQCPDSMKYILNQDGFCIYLDEIVSEMYQFKKEEDIEDLFSI